MIQRKSFLAQAQSVDPKLSPHMNQLMIFALENVKPAVTILAMIKLSREMVQDADQNLIKNFVKVYFQAIRTASAKVW